MSDKDKDAMFFDLMKTCDKAGIDFPDKSGNPPDEKTKDPEGFLEIYKACKNTEEKLQQKAEAEAPEECRSCPVFKKCHGKNYTSLTDLYTCEQIIKRYQKQ
jgi:hypothetical protein